MSQDDFFKVVGIIIVGCFVIYMSLKLFQFQTNIVEGLTNNNELNSVSGEAGTSNTYSAGIKAQTIKLQDELLVSKYRKDYENAIINLDDYIGYLMLKQSLNIKTDGDMKTIVESLNMLNTLKNSKDALNATMSFLDKQ